MQKSRAWCVNAINIHETVFRQKTTPFHECIRYFSFEQNVLAFYEMRFYEFLQDWQQPLRMDLPNQMDNIT